MRVALAATLFAAPDLLLLDEPTNHLDLEALLRFQDYLKFYAGGIIVISHDREFLNHIVSGIVEIRQSKLNRYRGNYDSFLVQREAAEAPHAEVSIVDVPPIAGAVLLGLDEVGLASTAEEKVRAAYAQA